MKRLPDRYGPWALVTGASEGIGEAFAQALAAEGFAVLLVARRRDKLEALAATLRQTHGVEARALVADLSRKEAAQAVMDEAASLDLGLLVAAAGFGTSGSFLHARIDEEVTMLEVNCRAVLELTHRFADLFARRGRGGIVLCSSLVAFQGVPRAATYAATKAWVQSLAEGIAPELRARGVDVIATAPGPVRSGFASRARMTMGASETPMAVARGTLAALGRRVTVRPGLLSKLLEFSLSFLPRSGRVRMMGFVMAGMTKEADGPDGGRLA
jgi:short-subunit dehydrogenase